jgi:hypothetical protein
VFPLVLALCVCAPLVTGCSWGGEIHTPTGTGSTPTPSSGAAALADARQLNHPNGAILITWPSQGERVLAYIIYRSSSPDTPIDIVDGRTTSYIDSANPVSGYGTTLDCTLSIDPNTGFVQEFSKQPSAITTPGSTGGPLTVTSQQLTVTCVYTPAQSGLIYSYQVRTVYLDYHTGSLTDPLQHPSEYRLLLGDRTLLPGVAMVIAPPMLIAPISGSLPANGLFRCSHVSGASEYVLDLCGNDPSFAPSSPRLLVPGIVDGYQGVAAMISLTELQQRYAGLPAPRRVYWRMGARVTGQPAPVALADANQHGYVYSTVSYFDLNYQPPNPP